MVRIAPVRLAFNPKTLWFDAGDFELREGDQVVVSTARGNEFGTLAGAVFDKEYEEVKKLKSPLKPVKRLAGEDDVAKADEAAALSREALPVFKRLAAEHVPDMNPIAVEYLFEGDKAVFYFDSEERVDFRELVRKLAAELHVRVDMKQIGVRDGARMVGGLGHCGQELCCRRLGGEFNPVSIRMAKEQDLSLNPQKISGICGRLMCCLRYEYDAYKDFHSRAPKKNAKVSTPDGEGKVVDLDVPREIVSVKVGDDKPVKVPLSAMDAPEEGTRPNSVGEQAWEDAHEAPLFASGSAAALFSTQLSGEDKLAEPGKVHHVHGDAPSSGKPRSRRRSGSASKAESGQGATARKQRRRSTTVSSDGTSQTERDRKSSRSSSRRQGAGGTASGGAGASSKAAGSEDGKQRSSRRRSRSRSGSRQQGQATQPQAGEGKSVQVGRNSSALRANRQQAAGPASDDSGQQKAAESKPRRRRRSHRAGNGGGQASGSGASANSGDSRNTGGASDGRA